MLVRLLSLLLVLNGCRTVKNDDGKLKVVGGELALETDSITKHTVGLVWENQNNNTNGCSGVLVGKRWVLTAAHCFTAAGKVEGLQVSFGTKRDTEPNHLIRASFFSRFERMILPSVDSSKQVYPEDDLALVKLESDAPIDYFAAKIAGPEVELNAGDLLVMAGFGSTKPDEKDAGLLRKAVLPLSAIDKESSQLRFSDHARSSDFKGSCFGDSGGPVFIPKDGELIVVGIASGGDYRCRERSIYTDIRPYWGWIIPIITDI